MAASSRFESHYTHEFTVLLLKITVVKYTVNCNFKQAGREKERIEREKGREVGFIQARREGVQSRVEGLEVGAASVACSWRGRDSDGDRTDAVGRRSRTRMTPVRIGARGASGEGGCHA